MDNDEVPECGPPPPRYVFRHQWLKEARNLMARNGTENFYDDGGHKIANNPLLIAAIENIRDGYFHLLEAKLKEQKKPTPDTAVIESIKQDMANHYHYSLQRLKTDDYGFSPEEKATIRETFLQTHPPQDEVPSNALTDQRARGLMASLIRCAVDSYRPFIRHEVAGFERTLIPTKPATPTAPQPNTWGHRTQQKKGEENSPPLSFP